VSPRPNVSDERKLQILSAAEQVFTQKGLDGARMDDIAEETGLSKGTLYLYFKKKDDLIIALVDRIIQGMFKGLESQKNDGSSAVEAIERFTEESIHDYKKVMYIMPVAYEFMALAFRNKTVQKALNQCLRRFIEELVPMVQKGIDSGEFRRVDAQEVAIAIGAIYQGVLLLWVYDRSLVNMERHIRSSIRLLLAGIRSDA
jgi:AcrR family transcriptional regulator